MKVRKKTNLFNRCFSFVVMLTMVFGLFASTPVLNAKAAENEQTPGESSDYDEHYYDLDEEDKENFDAITAENVAADKADNYITDSGEVVDIPTYSNPRLAADYIRKCFVERRSILQFVYNVDGLSKTKLQAEYKKIMEYVFEETPNSNEGDYLLLHVLKHNEDFGTIKNNSVKITLKPIYSSTASQENVVKSKVNSLLKNEFKGWETHSEAYNAQTVFDWVIDNFNYEIGNDNNKNSAYAGFNGTKVGYGYASASYMLLREMGVSNRVVASEIHVWNIVRIGGKYYNFDARWGDKMGDVSYNSRYHYFLVRDSSVKSLDKPDKKYHDRTGKYATSAFESKYPISTTTYEYDMSSDNATKAVKTVGVAYRTHVQSKGWENSWKKDGKTSGTSGQAKRLEAIQLKLSNNSGLDLGIEYKTHIQSYGWESTWKKDGKTSGTSGQAKRLEAIRIRLTGADRAKYDVYYRVHAQTYGWLGWAKNGGEAGTAGQGKRLEGIQVVVVKKGQKPSSGNVGYSYVDYGKVVEENSVSSGVVNYRTHVQSYGWQGYVNDGSLSGTYGEAKRLEGIRIQLGNTGYSGGIRYKTHIQTYGWEKAWKSNGATSGTIGQAKRLEAIQIELTGKVKEKYDVYYRVHAQTFGWLGWAKNGASAGTAGLGKRLESIQIVLVPKGQGAPSASTTPAYIQ